MANNDAIEASFAKNYYFDEESKYFIRYIQRRADLWNKLAFKMKKTMVM